ncbi:MAG: hypothetical protein EXR79_11735 [Myxococcales bacterium]|nr:hypothetical protein [Myxococcales bacterium]
MACGEATVPAADAGSDAAAADAGFAFDSLLFAAKDTAAPKADGAAKTDALLPVDAGPGGRGTTDGAVPEATGQDAGIDGVNADSGPAGDATPPPPCGDGACEDGESGFTCPEDCGPPPVCGDGVCEAGEKAAKCPMDCASGTSPACGDGVCQKPEGPGACAVDCDAEVVGILACLKGKCGGTTAICLADPSCVSALDGALGCLAGCGGDETCGEFCADSAATHPKSKAVAACGFSECNGSAKGGLCGNGVCEAGEVASSCPSDCAP